MGVSLFVARETLGTQCDTLVQFHVIADDAGRTDYDTRTVVNGKMMSDLRTRMDVDSGFGVSHFRDDTRNKRHVEPVKLVGNPVVGHCTDDGVTADNFTKAGGSRITIVCSFYIGSQNPSDFRQTADKFCC